MLAAPAPAAAQTNKRVAIVYSEPSAAHFFDRFAYNQLFMAMQHQAMMAGIPYDLLDEQSLTDITKLTPYQAIIIPSMQYVTAARAAAIEQTLRQAVLTYRIGLLTSGDLMTNTETGAARPGDPTILLRDLVGVTYQKSVDGVALDIRATNITHPVMNKYTSNELLRRYTQIWVSGYKISGARTSTLLAKLVAGTTTLNGVWATETGGRNVHFANDQVLGDTNIAWSALQWIVYGTDSPIALKIGRQSSVFAARNDMDMSRIAAQVTPVDGAIHTLITGWKAAYNFVGSFFINIGNQPSAGFYTDWNVTAPLLTQYMALGNEIGTHSWTHPEETSPLTPTQLEYEFHQSALEIGRQLGITVQGTAIPGMPEDLAVDDVIEPYFKYISGRDGMVGSGYPGAIGKMRPNSTATYMSLNMSPDFALINWLGYTPAQAQQVWATQFKGLMSHASQPIIHWMWHDYGPSTYNESMFSSTVQLAYNNRAEFVTMADLDRRIRAFQASNLIVNGRNPLSVDVNASAVGSFSLQLAPGQLPISSVGSWYAYDDDQVFLPETGGHFDIQLGSTAADVTHITALPMRARLVSVVGDGTNLNFVMDGDGTVTVKLNAALAANLRVQGASAATQSGQNLTLRFDTLGLHTVSLTRSVATNVAPTANPKSVTTAQGQPVTITLSGSDPEGSPLSYAIVSAPTKGVLTGTLPTLVYTPNAGFSGSDAFTFTVNDGQLTSPAATVGVTVTPVVVGNGSYSNPVTTLTVDGKITDWSALKGFTADPNDVTGTANKIDWLQGWMAHSASDLYLAYQNDGAITLSWGVNVYLDTDANSATGFTNAGQLGAGAEYLIQNTYLYKYTGNGSTWSWTFVANVTAAVSGSTAEFRLPQSQIGSPASLRLVFVGDNTAYTGGTTIDTYPNVTVTPRYFQYQIR